MSSVILRRVVPADRYALWLWANDPETRRASRDREPISWADHASNAASLRVFRGLGWAGTPVGDEAVEFRQ